MLLHNHKIPKPNLFCDVKYRMLLKFALELLDIFDTVLVILKQKFISKIMNNKPNFFLLGLGVTSSNPQMKESNVRFTTVTF